jgi:predicted nucleotidyltransferase
MDSVRSVVQASSVTMSLMTLDELRTRRTEIKRIAARRGARNIRVFGSVARGDALPASDIDFLVDFDADRTVLDLSALILDLQEALGCEVDVKEFARNGRAAERISREAVPL